MGAKQKYAVGSQHSNNDGEVFEVLERYDYSKIKIKFLRTGNEKIASLSVICRGTVKDDGVLENKKKYQKGEHYANNTGDKYEIIEEKDGINRVIRFNDTGYVKTTTIAEIKKGSIKDNYKKTIFGIGYLGDIDKFRRETVYKTLYSRWYKMIQRCYDKTCLDFKNYGGVGVTVCDRWHSLSNYITDIKKVKGYENIVNAPKLWEIDKDLKSLDCKIYSPDTVTIIRREENTKERNLRRGQPSKKGDKIVQLTQNGDFVRMFDSIVEASDKTGINRNSIRNVANKKPHSKTAGGYKWNKLKDYHEKTICILGFSSSGKDTISQAVSNDTGIPILISHTTRPPRNQKEIDEKTYYFVDEKFFADESKFIEMRKYNTEFGIWKYGLTSEELAKNPLSLFIVDRQGYEELSEVVGEESLISIFINVDEKTLIERQAKRGDDSIEFERRLEDDKKRFKGFMSDYIIDNYDLDLAVQKIKKIIIEELGDK